MSDDRDEWLRQRAYAIWEAEGRPHGRERENWAQAERELSVGEAARAEVDSAEAASDPVPAKKAKARKTAASKPSSPARSSRKKAAELRP